MHNAAVIDSSSISLSGLSKVFPNGTAAVDGASLEIPVGQFIALLGPSGCGKSTLLRMIAGLEQPTAGELMLPRGARMAFVFQDAHLMPWRTALGNVALPLGLSGVPKVQRLARAAESLARVGLAEAVDRYPAQLSGGMKMRVSLARAMVTDPTLLLLDEPFAALDEITRQQLDDQLYVLWKSRGMTVLFVTHSIMEATFLAQRAVVFSSRPARVVLDHAIDLPIDRPDAIRGEPQFARQMQVLLQGLHQGDAR
jgi:NitT/TauT family transport system ATP-binding protein